MHRLVSVCLFCVLDVEPVNVSHSTFHSPKLLGIPEEITQLSRSVNFCLPCVLSLSDHGSSHDVISVLGRNQIRCLQEDGSAVGERKVCPCFLSSKSRVNGLVDVFGASVGVFCDYVGVRGRVVLRKDGRVGDLKPVSRGFPAIEAGIRTCFPPTARGTSRGVRCFKAATAS